MEKEKLDLPTLEYIKFTFELYSDWSTQCLGYQYLCDEINKQKNLKPNGSKTVNRNEQLQELDGDYELILKQPNYKTIKLKCKIINTE